MLNRRHLASESTVFLLGATDRLQRNESPHVAIMTGNLVMNTEFNDELRMCLERDPMLRRNSHVKA
jgi:hypothetical protein